MKDKFELLFKGQPETVTEGQLIATLKTNE